MFVKAPFRIKCCGLTRTEDVTAAVACGFDALGLVFAQRSARRLELATACALREAVPRAITLVALFMDNSAEEVARVAAALRPDLLQFHGAEDNAWCAGFGVPYMKALAMGGRGAAAPDLEAWPDAAALLLDGHAPGTPGGAGVAFDWSRVPARLCRPWVLAGGLDADNVGAAINGAHPWGVDVSSGVESAPGIKDTARMKRFVAAVRARADDFAGSIDDG